MRFVGTIEAKTDAKGRAFLPASFRKELQAAGKLTMMLLKDIFEPYHALSTILVVPPGCEEAYRNTPGWREFRVIQSTMPTGDELKVDEIELRINELESQLTRARGEVRGLEAELDALKGAVSP